MSYQVGRKWIWRKSGVVPVHEAQACEDLLKHWVFAPLWFDHDHEWDSSAKGSHRDFNSDNIN